MMKGTVDGIRVILVKRQTLTLYYVRSVILFVEVASAISICGPRPVYSANYTVYTNRIFDIILYAAGGLGFQAHDFVRSETTETKLLVLVGG